MAEGIKVNQGDGDEILVDGENVVQKTDVVINENDKTITVGTGKTWILQFVEVKYIAAAGGSARQLRLEIGDGSNLIWFKEWGDTQAGGATFYYYAAAGLPDDSGEDADDRIRMELEAFVLPAGYTVRVFDADDRDDADDMEMRLVVDERNTGATL